MTRDLDLYAGLLEARDAHGAACAGDDRFTEDDVRPDDVVDVCRRCPILDPCRDYADAARPPAGVWAGRRWSAPPRAKGTAA